MAHISDLALFDYAAGKTDLTTQETEHLQDCDDCREEFIEFQRVFRDSADTQKTRNFLAEGEDLPLPAEPPKELHRS